MCPAVIFILKWSEHVDAIVSTKAASPLHFLKQLKRAGATYLYYGRFLSMHARYGTRAIK